MEIEFKFYRLYQVYAKNIRNKKIYYLKIHNILSFQFKILRLDDVEFF